MIAVVGQPRERLASAGWRCGFHALSERQPLCHAPGAEFFSFFRDPVGPVLPWETSALPRHLCKKNGPGNRARDVRGEGGASVSSSSPAGLRDCP
jgi:hypothetical protein